MFELRPYQVEDVKKVIDGHEGNAVVASGMGTGKTLLGVEVGRQTSAKRVLVVAPLNTFDGWEKTIKSQIPEAEVYIHPPGSSKTKKALAWWERVAHQKPGWYLIGWEAFRGTPSPEKRRQRRELEKHHKQMGMTVPERTPNRVWGPTGRWDLVIADEVHRACNRKSSTSKTLRTVNADRKVGMSGTPAGNKVEGFWAILHWLWPAEFPYFWPWVSKYCLTELDPHAGRKVVAELEPGGIVKAIPTYVRRTTEEVMGDLPGVIERKVMVDLKSGAQKKAYTELEEVAFTWLEGQPLHTPIPITLSIRLRQIALGVPSVAEVEVPQYVWVHPSTGEEFDKYEADAWREKYPRYKLERVQAGTDLVQEVSFSEGAKSNKIDALKDIVTDIPEGEPVLILTHSARFVVPVVHQLNKMRAGLAVAWTGGTTSRGRNAIKSDFGKKGGPRFIVAGIAAIGEGVDGLQKRCAHEIWLSQHDNNMLNQQAAARLHRGGQTRPVQRWIIQTRGTVDTKVYTRLEGNAKQMRAAYRKENPR